MKKDFKEAIFTSKMTVFTLRDIGILTGVENPDNLKAMVNYYVSRGVVRNIRRGVYAKNDYSVDELACRLYTPSYVSLETVLFRAGVMYQFSSAVTAVSYLSRTVTVEGNEISYRKIKNPVLIDGSGIHRRDSATVATPERAFLDMVYLGGNYYVDNSSPLDRNAIGKLLPLYACKAMKRRVTRILEQ